MGSCKVWAHWNHSFDVHLSYMGPVSPCASHPESPWCTVGGGCSGWLLGAGGGGAGGGASCLHPEFPQGSPTGSCNVMARWLQHPLFTDMAGSAFIHTQVVKMYCSCNGLFIFESQLLRIVSLWSKLCGRVFWYHWFIGPSRDVISVKY